MIPLALIGPGKWGKNYVEAAKETGIAEIAFQVRRTWREFLAEWGNGIDGTIVATPPESRADICIELAKRGIPMMVEKPVALSVDEVWRIASHLQEGEQSFKKQIPFLADYQHLFSPTFERMAQSEGDLRMRRRTVVTAHACGPTKRNYSLLWDYGPHFLAMAQSVGLWRPEKIHAVLHDEIASLHVRFSEGDFHLSVAVTDVGREFSFSTGEETYDGTKERPLVHAVRAFAQAVKDGGTGDTRFGIENTLDITRILEKAHVRQP